MHVTERVPLPRPVTRLLRRAVSAAGTGDNPGSTGGSAALDAMKRVVLGSATRRLPALANLSELRVDLHRASVTDAPVALPIPAGSAVLFHSLLLHASEPNRSAGERRAVILSYMGARSRVRGATTDGFLRARP